MTVKYFVVDKSTTQRFVDNGAMLVLALELEIGLKANLNKLVEEFANEPAEPLPTCLGMGYYCKQ
jgi:hypothetical protein